MPRRLLPRSLAALVVACVLALGAAPVGAKGPLKVAGCPVFPASNVWNKRVDRLPVHPQFGAHHPHHRPRQTAPSGL